MRPFESPLYAPLTKLLSRSTSSASSTDDRLRAFGEPELLSRLARRPLGELPKRLPREAKKPWAAVALV